MFNTCFFLNGHSEDVWLLISGRFVDNKGQGISPGCWAGARPWLYNINRKWGSSPGHSCIKPQWDCQLMKSDELKTTAKTHDSNQPASCLAFPFVLIVFALQKLSGLTQQQSARSPSADSSEDFLSSHKSKMSWWCRAMQARQCISNM